MEKRRVLFAYCLFITLVFYLFLPLRSAAAFSAQDLFTTASTSGSSGQVNIMDLLLGILLGKFFGQSASADHSGQNTLNSSGKELIGFYAEWYGQDQSSYQDFLSHTNQIGTIAPFWATLSETGDLTNRGGDDHSAVVALAHKNQRQVLLLVN
ncbi:MAG: glycoside hydrolase family 18, partial [Sporomusaceae bacterium]|nr:glycoside hydrolase family 18 [Sporomusaceae bacterium]